MNLLPTIRLAQSILKRKYPFVDKPLKRGPWKIQAPGLFFGILRYNKRSWGGHLFKDLVLCWYQVCISLCLTSVFIITWRQVNKVESICVQGLTCVLFIDNIEHLYSSNTANLHVYFLFVWVIECLITGLKLKMAYLWLQSLIQSTDFKSYSATICLMVVSVCTNTCYYMFFCIIKTLQNVKFIYVYKSPVIRAEAT